MPMSMSCTTDPSDHTKTEVTELQILREHASPLTTLCAHDASVVSAASDGRVLAHSFPRGKKHFVMAREEGKETDNTETTAFCDAFGGLRTVESPAERPTEVCSGPRLCRVGKTGLVRSSSSFQARPYPTYSTRVAISLNVDKLSHSPWTDQLPAEAQGCKRRRTYEAAQETSSSSTRG